MGIMRAVERRRNGEAIRAAIGFAASEAGDGVAYASLGRSERGGRIVRVAFRCRPLAALRGRDVSYAAVEAVAAELRRQGLRGVEIAVDDERLVADLAERLPLPAALSIPYVTLRCELNRFREATVVASDEPAVRDLTARARAEAFLQAAA